MKVSYISCGEKRIEEEIVHADFLKDIEFEDVFLRCTRPDGKKFDLYWEDVVSIEG